MAGLNGTRAKAVAAELSARTRVSIRRIYSLTADLRERHARADKGIRRIGIHDDVAMMLMKLVHELGFDASLALDTAIRSGLIAADAAPSPGTLLRWMRAKGVAASGSTDNRVCRRWEADFPNQIGRASCWVRV